MARDPANATRTRPSLASATAAGSVRRMVEGQLEVVTPLHIGSGRELSGAEVLAAHGRLLWLDVDKMLAALADNPDAADALTAPNVDLDAFLQEHGLKAGDFVRRSVRMSTRRAIGPRDVVLEAARTGAGAPVPYVPGSSLKGALVSGLLWLINAEARDPEKPLWISPRFEQLLQASQSGPYRSDRAMLDDLLGRDAHQMLTRAIVAEDAHAEPDDVQLFHVGLLHLRDPHGGHEWTTSDGRKTGDRKHMAPRFIEALAPGASLTLRFGFDRFLLAQAEANGSPIQYPREALRGGWLDPTTVLSGVNDLSFNALHGELRYFKITGVQPLIEQYEGLLARCEGLAANQVMLRLGWGINWHGVTGLLWDERTAKNLGLPARGREAFPFPKSRRIAFQGEQPLGTPGWCVFTIDSIDPA